MTIMNEEQASLFITSRYGLALYLDWMSHIPVPAGLDVQVFDFGLRVTVIVTAADGQVTLVGDAGTGDVAESSTLPGTSAIVDYARLVMEARMAVDGMGELHEAPADGELSDLLKLTGAHWIRDRFTRPGESKRITRRPHLRRSWQKPNRRSDGNEPTSGLNQPRSPFDE